MTKAEEKAFDTEFKRVEKTSPRCVAVNMFEKGLEVSVKRIAELELIIVDLKTELKDMHYNNPGQ